jgi:hypothetical protein
MSQYVLVPGTLLEILKKASVAACSQYPVVLIGSKCYGSFPANASSSATDYYVHALYILKADFFRLFALCTSKLQK